MMKYCLFEFFEEGSVDIGSTSYIDLEVEDIKAEHLNNDLWNFQREVLVNWPVSSSKQGKTSRKGNQKKAYVARVKAFSNNRLDEKLLRLRDEMLAEDEESSSPNKSSGAKRSRTQTKPFWGESFNVEVEEEDMSAAKKKKAKTKITQAREAALLERLAKKKETQSKSTADKDRIRELQDQVDCLTKERNSLVSSLIRIEALPDLLQEIKEIKGTMKDAHGMIKEIKGTINRPSNATNSTPVNRPSNSTNSRPTPSPSPSPKLMTHTDPISPKYVKKPSTTNNSSAKFIQDLMSKAFSRNEMANHSLTGGPSNANPVQDRRPQLDPSKMEEIFKKAAAQYPDADIKTLREAVRNKLSNERKLLKKQSLKQSKYAM